MKIRVACIFAAAILPCVGRAEVADSSSGGFTVKIVTQIEATAEVVYRKFVQYVGDWWNPRHSSAV